MLWTVLVLASVLWSAEAWPASSVRCTAADVPKAAAALLVSMPRCSAEPPTKPACAPPLIAATAELVAPSCQDDDLSAAERRCRDSIRDAATQFLAARLVEISRGQRATRHARAMDPIVEACRGLRVRPRAPAPPESTVVPTLGAPCAHIGGEAGDPFDARAAARCVRGAASEIANRLAPTPISPNFVVVMTDDQRWDTLAHMPRVTNDLAARGIRYRNAFVNTPICAPSRAAFLSGEYASNNGVSNNAEAAGSFAEATSIAPRLHAAGYRTGLFGIYLADLGDAVPGGWDEWYALQKAMPGPEGVFPSLRFRDGGGAETLPATEFDEVTDRLREKALAFLDASAGEPFLLWLGATAPHQPAIPAKRHARSLSDVDPWRPPSWNEEDVSDKPTWVRFLRSIVNPKGVKRVDDLRLAQLRSLLAVDDAVGGLSDRLERLGLTDETVFVFTSDNGHFWGEHGLSSKFAGYDEAIRVPLVIRYPRLVGAPRSNDDLALNVDLAETFGDLATLDRTPTGPGRSLVPTFAGEALGREEVLVETPGGLFAKPSLTLRTRNWKYIRTDTDAGVTEELYDLEADPFEMENLAADEAHGATKAQMGTRLDALVLDHATPRNRPRP